jgi:Leucine-rich repeat (LRR) protein
MKGRLEAFKAYFVDRKAPDGSDNGGVWPDDENLYSFKFEGEAMEPRHGGSAKIRVALGTDGKADDEGVLRIVSQKSTLLAASRKRDILLKNPIAKLRRFLGWFFLLVGVGLVTYVSTMGGRQGKACEEKFGACVWGRMEPKLYFKDGLLAGSTCGFGVDKNQQEDGWELDASGCKLEELGGWKEAFADLEVLDLSDNELAELPGWLGEGRMGKLRELRASNNKLENFTLVDWRERVGGSNSTALEVVDLRDNEIAELPYKMMDVKGEELRLMFDGNPCAEEVDWSGLGKDRLPVRMGVGYDNGEFGGSLRVLKMAHNELAESVFEELVAANFTRIEELDVSWNALEGIEEEVRGQKKLRRLDVSGNIGVDAR